MLKWVNTLKTRIIPKIKKHLQRENINNNLYILYKSINCSL